MAEGIIATVLVGGIAWTVLIVLATLTIRKSIQTSRQRGKVQLIRLNSNHPTGKVELVKPTNEGYEIPNGPYVKFENGFSYRDRATGLPIFVCNEDTGKIIRLREGEYDEIDGNTLAKFLGNEFVGRIANAGAGFNAERVLIVLGILALLGIVVLGFMMKGYSGGAA